MPNAGMVQCECAAPNQPPKNNFIAKITIIKGEGAKRGRCALRGMP